MLFRSNNKIIGIKDIKDDDIYHPAFIMMFDMNGLNGPNTWGKDVFGINIFVDEASLTFEISALRNDDVTTGLGVVAEFDTPHTGAELLAKVKKEFNVPCVKAGGIFEPDSRIRRIALCGGAGGEFIPSAAAAGAQLYISEIGRASCRERV